MFMLCLPTGTHGNGIGYGNIAAMVTRLELVTGTGEIITLSADHQFDVFRAAGVSVNTRPANCVI